MTQRGLFLSDLHLFSRRSVGLAHWSELQVELRRTDRLILGGDIFDFRWSRHKSLQHSLDAAGNWLTELTEKNSHLQVVYLLGNHDCHEPMQRVLAACAADTDRFHWERYVYRLGERVFLHGDVIDAGSSAEALDAYRDQFAAEDQSRGRLANYAYDVAVRARIHRYAPQIIHRHRRSTVRLSRYLASQPHVSMSGVHYVYFGHTHVACRDVRAGEQVYHNAGSGIRHLTFLPSFFDC